jgi:Ras GTPase-activating-like protein IQGAP2/3
MHHLLVETKRYVLYIIRVQSGSSLLAILDKPSGEWEERRFAEILRKEEVKRAERQRRASGQPGFQVRGLAEFNG